MICTLYLVSPVWDRRRVRVMRLPEALAFLRERVWSEDVVVTAWLKADRKIVAIIEDLPVREMVAQLEFVREALTPSDVINN